MKRYIIHALTGILLVSFMGGCGSSPTQEIAPSPTQEIAPSPTLTPTEAIKQTQVVIDGRGEDWQSYPTSNTDPEGDHVNGTPDLGEVRAFSNDRFFYLYLHLNSEGNTDHYDVLMDVDGGQFDYQVSFWPKQNQAVFAKFPVTGDMEPLESVFSAQDEVIEMKMPLSVVDNRKVQSIQVQTWMDGVVGDQADNMRVATVDEAELDATMAIVPSAGTTPTPTSTPSGPIPIGTIVDKKLTLKVTHQTGVGVNLVQFDSNNDVFTVDFLGDTIYKLMNDGRLETYMSFSNRAIGYFNFAPDGSIWFVDHNDWGLYHVDADGKPQKIANQTNRVFVFDSAGNLIAVDYYSSDTVQRISPDGMIENLATGIKSQRIAIAPDDSIFIVTSKGELMRIDKDGAQKVIAAGFGIEDQPAFGPNQELYVLGGMGLVKVDTSNGAIEKLKWYDRYRVSVFMTLNPQGIGYIYHPNTPLYRMDLDAESIDMVYSPYGNSWAMAVDPLTEVVYVAYGNYLPDGNTTLFRVNIDGSLEDVGSVAYGSEGSMTFAPDGTGYLAVSDSIKGSMIFTFDPQEGVFTEFQQPNCVPKGITVEPSTGALWWMDCNQLVSYSESQGKQSIPYFDGVNNNTMAFGADGSIYTLPWLHPKSPQLPSPHGIYHYENDNWVLLNDMTTDHPGIVLGELTTCPNGKIYVAASVEDEIIPGTASWSALLRMEDDYSLTLLGYNLGNFDPLAISCAPSGTVYFTNAQGIYSAPNLGATP